MVEIRALTQADADAYRVLRLRALREHPEAFGTAYDWAAAQPLSFFAARIAEPSRPDDFYLGAFEDGQLIGNLGFARGAGAKERHKGTLIGMHVAEQAGRGVGRALLNAAIERARALPGLVQVELAVVSENERAAGLYRSRGFETYGREPRALYVDGRYLDEELMVLRLA